MPGRKWSTLLPTGSMGMRATDVQVRPSVLVVMTMSLAEHEVSKRQSAQTT